MIFSGLVGAYLRDKGGNIAMIGALALPVVIFAGGVALDATNMMLTRNRLQNGADSGALAASSGLANKTMTVDQAKSAAVAYVVMAMQNFENSSTDDHAKTDLEQEIKGNTLVDIKEKAAASGAKAYDITVTTALTLPLNPMTTLFASSSPKIEASSKTEATSETKNALSMYLVLDRSGSMAWKTASTDSSTQSCYVYEEEYWPEARMSTPCYVSKIATLKAAVAGLMAQLNTADPAATYVRTAAVSYNDNQDPSGTLTWGTEEATTYVNNLTAIGGTDSSTAFGTAYNAISAATETLAHVNKTGLEPTKFILFMTDGENTHYKGRDGANSANKSDNKTKASCDKARASGIKVYTVAFMAPDRGKALLDYCATDETYAYKAENSADLISAFAEIGSKASQIGVRLTQ